jgi:hypothetical protein
MANQPRGQQAVKFLIWAIAFGAAYFASRTLMDFLR